MAAALLLPSVPLRAQQPAETANPDGVSAADHIANAFSQLGDQIYDECIFELSEEQLEVQQALIQAYVAKGASSTFARQLAVRQIQPPKLSEKCEEIRNASKTEPRKDWSTDVAVAKAPTKPEPVVPKGGSERFAAAVALAAKKVLPQWDCASNVDFVTIKHKGYERKLTGGEICNPFRDVVHKVPDALADFRLGYTIRTGRLFVISDDAKYNGKTIAWAISGREICRNNPDPDCLAARAVGPLPPGEYSFADKSHRLNWGPTSKRMVAGVYLNKLFDREKYSRAQTAAILARGNIAIHVRLKGEMSEACLGLEPDGWTYVSGLIKDGRATGLTVRVDEPHPQIAEKAPIQTASTFSLTSLFKSQ
ncbi:MAG TPA: DUF2778 domain-containing protein [Hyphomicrobiaceae bacterium]